MNGPYKYVSGTVALPPELTGAVEEAAAKVAASGGTVDLYVSACEFDTWWADHHRGRRSKSIELTPMIRIGNADRDLFMSLIVHENDTGKVWAHPDMVHRMAAWIVDGGDADFDALTFPYSDEAWAKARHACHGSEG
jgi:hypothetical protein